MQFTNENIKKEQKKVKKLGLVWILCLLGAVAIFFIGALLEDKETNDIKDLHTIILSDEKDKTSKSSYVLSSYEPYKFAVYKGKQEAYYFLFDEKFMYVAYMNPSDYYKLKLSTKDNIIKAEGLTRKTPNDIRKLAIDAYNDAQKDEKNKLTYDDFEDYFGSVCLDLTKTKTSSTMYYTASSFILFIISTSFLLAQIIRYFNFNRPIKKLDTTTLLKLDDQMNSSDSFYYKNAHLYLTKDYIIKFDGKFRTIAYDDILWLYPFEYRVNGAKSSQSIMVQTKNGKKYSIANINVITKAKEEAFKEIFNTIASKNDKIILGYTKEAREKVKAELAKYKN